MSTAFLKFIPSDPSFVPDERRQRNVFEFLTVEFGPSEIEIKTTDHIEFVDSGENFAGVSCNLCKKKMSLEFWQNKMDSAFKNKFSNLLFKTECCQNSASLHDLVYDGPCGFARFVISIRNPDYEHQYECQSKLEKILATELRQVYSRI